MRAVVVDDERLFTELLKETLEAEGVTVVGAANDVEMGRALICLRQPDVAVLDMRFPRGSGLELAGQVRKESPGTRILMLTALPEGAVSMLDSQLVDGVLDKAAGLDALVTGVQRVAAGLPVRPRLLERRPPTPRQAVQQLTSRERQVLAEIATGASTSEIADLLGVATSTARSHVQSVLQKLGVHSRLEAVRYAPAALSGLLPAQSPPPAQAS